MGNTMIGWCPGRRSVDDMLGRYPETRAVRIFVGPDDPLPTWDGPILGPLGDRVVPHLSFKRWDPALLKAWAWAKPPGRLLILTYGHEPEQGEAGGDPPLDVWRTRWAELVNLMADHPERHLILLVPTYTRFWWQKNAGDLRWLVAYPGIDAIGWDIYSAEPDRYRTPDDLLTVPRDIAARTDLPYLIAELGAVRIATDRDGAGRQKWMRAMVAAAVADRAITCCWFHKDAWDLAAGSTEPERQTWRDIIEQEATDVGRQRRLAWINDGSPFRLMTPLAQLRDTLRRHGYTVYDIGNTSHLEHDPPEDHTPYSATGYPGEAQYGVGYAIDIMPPPAGSGLPSLQKLGAQLLADRKGGVAAAKWLKYMNWEPERDNGGDCWHESWQPTYTRRTSSDRGHIHLSGLTGYETSTIAAGYDPVARIGGEDDDMDQATFDKLMRGTLTGKSADAQAVQVAVRNLPYTYPVRTGVTALNALYYEALPQITAGLKALGEAVARESSNPDEIRALLADLPKPEPVDVDQVAGAVAERVLAALPDGDAGPVSREDLEAALRSVLGSLDGATPQG